MRRAKPPIGVWFAPLGLPTPRFIAFAFERERSALGMEDCMQESGSTSPVDDGQGKNPPAAEPRRKGDPVVRWLTLAIIIVVIFWLVSMLSAMMFGVIMPPKTPRTAAERDLSVLTAEVDTGRASTQTYARYIGALIRAGQLSKAQSALDQSMKVAKTDKSYLLAEQTQLLLVRKDYKGTASAADKAMAEAEKELKAFMDNNVKNNRRATAGAVMPTSYSTAALAKASALVASEDFAGAIKAFDAALAQDPSGSDVLVARAHAKAKVGDKNGAEADYRAALKYIPDYKPALDGLKQIGAAQ
jgi:tetratricopeptide (TPR) repeat protein